MQSEGFNHLSVIEQADGISIDKIEDKKHGKKSERQSVKKFFESLKMTIKQSQVCLCLVMRLFTYKS